MPNCANCASPIVGFRCPDCNNLRPASSVPFYCNKKCQKAHWKVHESHCRLAQYFDRVKDLHVGINLRNDGATKVFDIGYEMGAPYHVLQTVMMYILLVKPPVREIGPREDTRLKHEVVDAIHLLRGKFKSKEEYAVGYEKRVTKKLKEMSRTPNRAQVPFEYRKWTDVGEVVGLPGDLAKTDGVELFAQDWAVLDLESYGAMYGGMRRHYIDPWACSNPEAITAKLFYDTYTPTLP